MSDVKMSNKMSMFNNTQYMYSPTLTENSYQSSQAPSQAADKIVSQEMNGQLNKNYTSSPDNLMTGGGNF